MELGSNLNLMRKIGFSCWALDFPSADEDPWASVCWNHQQEEKPTAQSIIEALGRESLFVDTFIAQDVVKVWSLSHQSNREDIMSDIADYVSAESGPIIRRLVNCAEEIVMNSLAYHPVDGAGNVEIRLSRSQDAVFLRAIDNHGTLEPRQIWKYLRTRAHELTYSSEAGHKGGGLGFYKMISNCPFIDISIDPRNFTQTTFRFPVDLAKWKSGLRFIQVRRHYGG